MHSKTKELTALFGMWPARELIDLVHDATQPLAQRLLALQHLGFESALDCLASMGVAQPLLLPDLLNIVHTMPASTKGLRDKALLLMGFAGAFRRSELVALNYEDIETVREGLVVHMRQSKTDQVGVGRKIGIPHARGSICPVKSLQDWLAKAGIERGALFRRVTKGGAIGERLSDKAVALVVKEHGERIGLDPSKLSGHSLRAGLATSAAQQGIPSHKIRAQTGHASDAMLNRYIRDSELFTNNAAGLF